MNELEVVLKDEPKISVKRWITYFIIISIIVWSFLQIDNPSGSTATHIAVNIFKGIFTPSLDLIFSFDAQSVPYLLLQTIAIAFLGTLAGAIIAIIPAFLGSYNITNRVIANIVRLMLNLIRSIPAIVYGLMFVAVVGQGPFAGVLTFSLISISMIAKLYIEAIEDIDKSVLESLDACGATIFQKVRFGIMPQISGQLISTSIYRFEINVKDAAILGLVGAGGIGSPLLFAMNDYRWNDLGAYLLGLIVLVIIVENISSYTRNKLVNG